MNRLRLILAALLMCLSFGYSAKGQEVGASQRQKIDGYRRDIALLEDKIRANDREKGSAATKLELIRASVRARKALVAESNREIAMYDDTIATKTARIHVLQARLDTLMTYYSRLVRNAYKNRNPRMWYIYVLASENVGQAFRRIGFFKSLSSQMSAQAQKIRQTKDELGEQKKVVEQLRSQADEVRALRKSELAAAEKEERAADALYNSIIRNGRKYKREADAKRAEINRLNAELERLRREAAGARSGKANSSSSGSRMEIDKALAAQFNRNKGKLPWPADGPVIAAFGSYSHPLHKNVNALKNNGINIGLKPSGQVTAIFDGTVIKIFEMSGYGNCIAMDHGDHMSLYCRLKDISVKKGEKVKTGQLLGRIATLGGETYLHFEIWDTAGKPVNPELWLKK